MFILDEKLFSGGLKLCGLPLKWFRSVSAFLNSFCGENGVKVRKPTNPTVENPVIVSIDEEWLKTKIGRLEKANDTATAPPVSTIETDENNNDGIARSTTAYTSGDNLAQAAARVTPKSTGTWTAGAGKNLARYEVSSIAPFMYSTTRYAKVFVRLNIYSPSGKIISQGEEVDQNIIIRLY